MHHVYIYTHTHRSQERSSLTQRNRRSKRSSESESEHSKKTIARHSKGSKLISNMLANIRTLFSHDKTDAPTANQKDILPPSHGTLPPTTPPPPSIDSNSILNLDHGDPLVFEPYWKKMSEECTVVIKGHELMSYFTDPTNVCWFLLPQLRDAIKRLHGVIGNAVVTDDRHIVVGTGSTQLFQASLFALSSSFSDHNNNNNNPVNVVAAAPFYSEYSDEIGILRPGLYQWAGDANVYDKNEPYIEVVTSPNNPDGNIRGPVVKSEAEGKLIHDCAYYWPQYTAITHPLDQDILLFTFSKCTGHAGSRIGWAIVKDIQVAEKMTRYVRLSSIGVSRESQTRATKIIDAICDAHQHFGFTEPNLFFVYAKRKMRERWEKLRAVAERSKVFTVAKSPSSYCKFTHELSESYPAFVWLKSEKGIEDSESYLKELKVTARGGRRFGVGSEYARLSILSSEDVFNEFLKRLSNAKRE